MRHRAAQQARVAVCRARRIARASAARTPVSCSRRRSTRAQSAGESVSATSPEIATAAATVTPNSPKSRPVVSERYASGRNTATTETVDATTANEISRMPRIAASRGGVPPSTQRVMFSSTMIASSTTRPIASVSPISVSVLIVKPAK